MSEPQLGMDDDFIKEALPAFISEAQEQTDALEQLLLQLEDAPEDRGLLDALCRCAHTVKGSAGIFGLDQVVGFTHHVETLLDRLREGELTLSPELSTLLLESNDVIRRLVELALHPETEGDEERGAREALVARLREAAGGSDTGTPTDAAPEAEADLGRQWHLSAHFGPDTLRNGMDPLAILNYVRGLGEIPRLACDEHALPALDELDPERCYLGFEFSLASEASRSDIEGAFSFVRDDCELRLIEPGARPKDFAALIADMPDNPRLGDILVGVGAITRAQLDKALKEQAQAAAESGSAKPLGEILQAGTGLSPKVVAAALQKQSKRREPDGRPSGTASGEDNRYIRVEAGRLDEVINLLGELVTASAGGLLMSRQSGRRELVEASQQVSTLVEDIRNATLQLRMVPIGETFARFRRVVRDTAAELGKEVALEIVGGETELDKSMVERIADPLMHLVRNALDHGLETAEQRLESGKPAQGRLTLSACHESGRVLIRIVDDGRGIQRDRVLQRAWERGLLEPGVEPPDEEVFKLIFEPGFSTAEAVTKLSGRGVGMDVVRRNIEALRGTVTPFSVSGQGSTIEIRLPLTTAIIDGFLVSVGDSKFIFPLDAVEEVIENRPTATVLDDRGRSMVDLRGQALPVLDLRGLYGLEAPSSERSSVAVIQGGSGRFGVMVDQLHGQHQTVIKPLGRMLRGLRGMSGSSILGNGEVALIFDPQALSRLAAEAAGTSGGASPPRPRDKSNHLHTSSEGQAS